MRGHKSKKPPAGSLPRLKALASLSDSSHQEIRAQAAPVTSSEGSYASLLQRSVVHQDNLPLVLQQDSSEVAASSSRIKRRDAPEVSQFSKGSRKKARAIARDPIQLQLAVERLQGKVHAASSKGTADARLDTWDMIACDAQVDPNSFSPTTIFTIMAVLTAAGYRSAELYLAEARSKFISKGKFRRSRTSPEL